MKKHTNKFSLKKMAKIMKVSRSGHYAYLKRAPSKRALEKLELIKEIKSIYQEHRGLYGSPRIHVIIKRCNVNCSRKRIANLMREVNLRAKMNRSFKHRKKVKKQAAPNLLKQNFYVDSPDNTWVSDISYIKTSTGWFYGFKLHLIINDAGEIIAYMLTAGNVDDRVPVPNLSKNLFGDKGYISQELFMKLYEKGVEIITRLKRNMKNKLMPLVDKILLRKRGIIESVNNKLKNSCQIEYHRHRSRWNFLINVISGIVAYAYDPCKPSIQFTKKQKELLFHLI
jgi:transposase InsO family protein